MAPVPSRPHHSHSAERRSFNLRARQPHATRRRRQHDWVRLLLTSRLSSGTPCRVLWNNGGGRHRVYWSLGTRPLNTLACGGAWSVERSGICVQWQWHAVSENTDAVRPRGRPAYMREASTAQSPFARPRLMFLGSVFRPRPLLYGVHLLPPQALPCTPSRLPNFVSPSDVASRRVRVHAHQHDRLQWDSVPRLRPRCPR
ncbi:hypothetical protein V8D89_013379 [Ganoderma adspersum]